MSEIGRLALDIPALLIGRPVPFTTGVVIQDAVLLPQDEDVVIVRVRFANGGRSPGTFEFELDGGWGFDTAQDAVDQLYIDLVEHLDTGGR